MEFPQFNGRIGPGNLLSLVRNTAPYYFQPQFTALAPPEDAARLIDGAAHPYGWLRILLDAEKKLEPVDNPSTEQREDYFALCLACHHATVATFIPTDVDSKIRGHLWRQREDPAALRRMLDFVLHALKWDVSRISTRATELSGVGPVSGHNGEMLGVLAGGLGAFLHHGDTEYAEKAAAAIQAELEREAHEFRFVLALVRAGKPRPAQIGPAHYPRDAQSPLETDLLRLASSLTHNVGDLDQGISFWSNRDVYQPYRAKFGRLAHENSAPIDGTFQLAAGLYKKIMSSEGHRHYPLREVRALRSSPEFLLPLGPFLDRWGAVLGRHRDLNTDARAEALAALLSGCKKIPGQTGYYRAISGMLSTLGEPLDTLLKRIPAALRHAMNDSEIKRHAALKQISYESGMKKSCLSVLKTLPGLA